MVHIKTTRIKHGPEYCIGLNLYVHVPINWILGQFIHASYVSPFVPNLGLLLCVTLCSIWQKRVRSLGLLTLSFDLKIRNKDEMTNESNERLTTN